MPGWYDVFTKGVIMLIAIAIYSLVFAVLTANVAHGKGRNRPGWLLGGLVFGVLGLILVAVLPITRRERCRRGWA
jgi:Na+/melibiose symporter-like transporter